MSFQHSMFSVRRCVSVFTLGFALSVPAWSQVVVIVNPKSSTANMSADQAANLFLGKTPGVLVDLGENSPVREQFYSKVTGKTSSQVKAVWARLAFSGKAVPPKELATSDEVKKFVASNPDAIGYIEKSAVDSTVKAVLELN